MTSLGLKKNFATADIAIGNGVAFRFDSEQTIVINATNTMLGINFLDADKGVSIYLSFMDYDGIKEKSYPLSIKKITKNNKAISSLVLSPVNTDLFPSKFDSKANLGDDFWTDVLGNLTITSLAGPWLSGTFFAVIYNKHGDKAQISNGKFKVKVDY